MFPFDATKANFCRGFTDLFEVLSSSCRGKVRAFGAGVGAEPFFHSGLVLCRGVLVSEYVGHFALLTVVWTWGRPLAELWGPPGMRYEFQKSLRLSEIVLGERARWAPSRVVVVGDR